MAAQVARFRAAMDRDSGLQILTVSRLAGRLAGGFVEPVPGEILQTLVRDSLNEGGFQAIGTLADLPGMVRATTATLTKAWNADLDLQARASRHPRIADLALIERRIAAGLTKAMLLPHDLSREALGNIGLAPPLLGSVSVEGVFDLAPCWRQLIRELASTVPVEWNASTGDDLSWLEGSAVKVVHHEVNGAKPEAVVCANPRHEALEALRWARRLIVNGHAQPGEIALTAAAVEPWDDHIRAIADESDLPVHFAHGRNALTVFPGQQAAALADVLVRGLSRSRVVRLISLCRRSSSQLMGLPENWKQAIQTDSSLMSLQQWEYVWKNAASRGWPSSVDQRKILKSVLELVAKSKDSAPEAGECFLQGQSLALWQQALREGPAAALETTLSSLRFEDGKEPAVSIFWGPAHILVSSPRSHIRLLGLNSRNWPRRGAEDPLLPDYVVPSKHLQPFALPTGDRMNFGRLVETASGSLVFSRCRRDSEGRLLGRSSLLPRDLKETHIHRTRIPEHAVSESDRILARGREFAESTLSRTAENCWRDWGKRDVTAHDGLIKPDRAIVMEVLSRTQSSGSLQRLLRDPIGFLWKYVFRWEGPLVEEDILSLDKLRFGNLTHEILAEATGILEKDDGFATATKSKINRAIAAATRIVSNRWDAEESIPPLLLWQGTLRQAEALSVQALITGEKPLTGQKSWVELAFGGLGGKDDGVRGPWAPQAQVRIPHTDIHIRGRIDRLDVDGAMQLARVTDYKTGKFNNNVSRDPLDGGKELQRSLYYVATKALLPGAEVVESRLLFPGQSKGLRALQEPEEVVRSLSGFLTAAKQLVSKGFTVPGAGAEDNYNDLVFALPSNAQEQYLIDKSIAFREILSPLIGLWEGNGVP
jgi:PD-(D/E)XK nuclease superfamily